MEMFSPDEFEDDLMFDLLDEITTHVDQCETDLVMLEHDPENNDLLASLFRSVHTIKGDIQIVNMEPMVPLISAVEDILGMLRAKDIHFNGLIADLSMTVLEIVQVFVDECAHHSCCRYDPELHARVLAFLQKIKPNNLSAHEELMTQALLTLDPSLSSDAVSSLDKVEDTPLLDIRWEEEIKSDLSFFEDMMVPIERRIDNWSGRSERQLKLAKTLNSHSGNMVNEQQLSAAVLLHDVGMALLPVGLMRKQQKLSQAEQELIHSHLFKAANMLIDMPHWAEARSFILAHHERFDGSGYPKALSGSAIPHGARILALVDAFEAMTHARSQTTHRKRPIAHAAQEILLNSGSQLCPYWVDIFTEVFNTLIRKRA